MTNDGKHKYFIRFENTTMEIINSIKEKIVPKDNGSEINCPIKVANDPIKLVMSDYPKCLDLLRQSLFEMKYFDITDMNIDDKLSQLSVSKDSWDKLSFDTQKWIRAFCSGFIIGFENAKDF